MSLLELMSNRYSCRRYSSEAIRKEDLEKILATVKIAPTAHNNQPQKIYVLNTEKSIVNLMEVFPFNFKAPCYLVCAYDEIRLGKKEFNENGEIDVAIVMTHMMLMAEELGLGACWIAHFNEEAVGKKLGLPANEKVVGVLSLGYHREDDRPSKLHSTTRTDEELIVYL